MGSRAWARHFGGCHCEDSNTLEQAGQSGAAQGSDTSRPGSRAPAPELGCKLGKVGKLLQSVLCSNPYFSPGLIFGPTSRQGAAFLAWWPPSHPFPLRGAVAQRAVLVLFHVYWRSFRDHCRGPLAPPDAPASVPPLTPHLHPDLCVPSPPGPTQFCTTRLSLTCSWLPPNPPPVAPP